MWRHLFDHLPQFLISPNTFSDPPSNKSSVSGRDRSNFDQLNKLINKKDPQSKAIFHEQYKTYRNLISLLMKQSKFIIQHFLKPIGITLKILGKESKL